MPSRPKVFGPVRLASATPKRPVGRDYKDGWREYRERYLRAYPACCEPGCDRPATEVDHIVAVKVAPDRRLDPTNCRPYCKRHHSARTARDQGFGKWSREGGQKIS